VWIEPLTGNLDKCAGPPFDRPNLMDAKLSHGVTKRIVISNSRNIWLVSIPICWYFFIPSKEVIFHFFRFRKWSILHSFLGSDRRATLFKTGHSFDRVTRMTVFRASSPTLPSREVSLDQESQKPVTQLKVTKTTYSTVNYYGFSIGYNEL
jgi:hypothetical protein